MTTASEERVLSLLVGTDEGHIKTYFGIFHENSLWLVTAWLINSDTGFATPERMIRIDQGKYQESDPESRFDYENILLPKAAIDGVTESVEGYTVRSLPESPTVHRSQLFQLPQTF